APGGDAAAAAAAAATVTRTIQCEDGTVDLVLGFTNNRLSHFVNRHTYRHFDFDDIKPMNIFWPANTDQAAVSQSAQTTLGEIGDKLVGQLDGPGGKQTYEVQGELGELVGN